MRLKCGGVSEEGLEMFCRPTDGPTILCCCPSVSFRARINSVAVHVPIAVGLFYFAAVDNDQVGG